MKEHLNKLALKYKNLSKERILQLQTVLDENRIDSYSNDSKEIYIAIAIKDGLDHFRENCYLVAKKDQNNIIQFVQVIHYTGTTIVTNKAELFSKIYSQIDVNDGTYEVLNIIGNYQYELTYANDKLSKLKVKSKKENVKNISTATPLTLECQDWYWVTTYYYEDGTTYQTWDYIGRTCQDNCPPNDICEPQGDPGGGGNGPDSLDVSKPKNWLVASGGGSPATWKVFSDDNLFGKRTPSDPINKGYFTGVTHSGSNVVNNVGNEQGIPFSVWTEENRLPSVYAPGVATSYVKGRLTFSDGSTLPNINKTGMWLFVNEF